MITISKNQLEQIEYLISQSIQGNHVLFDTETVRAAFAASSKKANSPISNEEAYAVEPLIERLIELPTLAEKRAYLDRLDPGTFRKVVQTYFNIVENSLFEEREVKH